MLTRVFKLGEKHGCDLLGGEGGQLAHVIGLDEDGIAGPLDDVERAEVLLFKLDSRIVEGASDEPLQVVYRVFDVGDLGLLSCDNWERINRVIKIP